MLNIQKLPWLLLSQHQQRRGSLTAKVTSRAHTFHCSEAVVCLPAWESKFKGPGHSECTFKYLNYSRCQFISDTWTVLGMGMKQNQAAPVLFKYLKWTPEFFIKRLVNLKLWNVSVLFWPGLVSVCLTRATVFKRTSRGSSTLSETACVAKKNLNKIFWTK